MAMSIDRLKALKQALKVRQRELRNTVREELLRADEQGFAELAGQVHDRGDESVADLLVDVELAVIDQHVHHRRHEQAVGDPVLLDCREARVR